jgi:signal transduction histidine kinase/DNA-binding response OmpR family regulator
MLDSLLTRDGWEVLLAYADYAWFVAVVGWLFVLGLWWRQPPLERRQMAWIATTALAGVGTACLEVALHATAYVEYYRPREGWDLMLGLIAAAGPAGFAFGRSQTPPESHRPVLVACLLALLAALGVLRHFWPLALGAALAFASTLAALLWLRRQPRIELGFATAALLACQFCTFNTIGPVAEWLHEGRRWAELSLFAWPAAVSHITVAGLLVWQLTRRLNLDQTRSLLIRRFACGGMAWLLAGFVVAWLASASARESFVTSAQTRARTAALILDGDRLGALLGPEFQLTQRTTFIQHEGWESVLYIVPRLRSPDVIPFRDALKRIKDANPDVRFVDFSTLRRGLFIAALYPTGAPGTGYKVAVRREAHALYTDAWVHGTGFIEGPLRNSWGTLFRACAPVKTSDGRMVGWLTLQWGASVWALGQSQARLLTFAVLGLGIIAGGLWLGQLWRTKEREDALRQAAAAAAADQAKTAFLAKVSHELRTPLQGILGYTNLLNDEVRDLAQRQRLAHVLHEAEHLRRLVEDLLDLSALDAGGFRLVEGPAELPRLVEDVVDSMMPRATAKSLQLSCWIDPVVPTHVRLDVVRVRQILLNLVGNAIKYTTKGSVSVEVTLRESNVANEPPFVWVAVRDTGPGITLADQVRLFQPFVRLEAARSQDGLGLGLALAAALTKRMGGRLAVESDGVAGSVFSVSLPARQTASPASPLDDAAELTGRFLNHTILVVEDNRIVRELFVEWLQAGGATCLTAVNGAAVDQLVGAANPDAIILDVSLPDADGCEIATRLRVQENLHGRSRRLLVGVSAHADPAERERGLRAGMDVFLTKPVSRASLYAALRRELVAVDRTSGPRLDLPPSLSARFHEQFAAEWPGLAHELSEALQAATWDQVAAKAHYLKNSADVLNLEALRVACARLEAAARAGLRPGAEAAWSEVTRAVDAYTLPPVSSGLPTQP